MELILACSLKLAQLFGEQVIFIGLKTKINILYLFVPNGRYFFLKKSYTKRLLGIGNKFDNNLVVLLE